MKVKEKYSFLSEQLMFEWTHETPTVYNRNKRNHYAFWHSIKELTVAALTFNDIMRVDKIIELQRKELKRPTYRR